MGYVLILIIIIFRNMIVIEIKFRIWDERQQKYHYSNEWLLIALNNQNAFTFEKKRILTIELL